MALQLKYQKNVKRAKVYTADLQQKDNWVLSAHKEDDIFLSKLEQEKKLVIYKEGSGWVAMCLDSQAFLDGRSVTSFGLQPSQRFVFEDYRFEVLELNTNKKEVGEKDISTTIPFYKKYFRLLMSLVLVVALFLVLFGGGDKKNEITAEAVSSDMANTELVVETDHQSVPEGDTITTLADANTVANKSGWRHSSISFRI